MGYQHFLAASVAIILTACGSSSNNTQAPAETKTTISVADESGAHVAHAVLIGQDGSTLFDGDVQCGATVCNVYLPIVVNQPSTIQFQDRNGRMIHAFQFPSALHSFTNARFSAYATGAYLISRLTSQYMPKDIGWIDTNLRLASFFQNYESPDGTPDQNQEVGLYYAKQLQNAAMTESQFLSNLRDRLVKWDVATSDELPASGTIVSTTLMGRVYAWLDGLRHGAIPLISQAQAQDAGGGCTSGLQTFLGQTQNVGGMLPVVGQYISGIMQIFQDGCGTANEALSKITADIAMVKQSVDTVGTNLGTLTIFQYDQALNQKTAEFENLKVRTETLSSEYQLFLQNNSATSLVDYFDKNGGWNSAYAKGSESLKRIMTAPYSDTASGTSILQAISNVTNDAGFNSYLSAMKNRCETLPQYQTANFVNLRQSCNNYIQSNTAFLVGAQTASVAIFKDVYAVLDKYKDVVQADQSKVINAFPLPAMVATAGGNFATAPNIIQTNFKTQQANLIASYTNNISTANALPGRPGYFNVFAGLNQGMLDQIVRSDCAQTGEGRNSYPEIVGWYAPDADSNNNYIVTECKSSYNAITKSMDLNARVKGRYFYNKQGNADANVPANVMGVLVARGWVDGTQREYTDSNGARIYNTATFEWGTLPNWLGDAVVGVNNTGNRTPVLNVVKYDISNSGVGSIRPRYAPYGYEIFQKQGLAANNFNWVTFKDSSGFHYAVYVQADTYWNNNNVGVKVHCMTYDCEGTGADWQPIKFKYGPKSVDFWSKNGTTVGQIIE